MNLIVGLGNPGKKYKKTRHNIGFLILDKFKRKNKFPNWRRKKELKAQISDRKVGRKKIILAKSQTFMNDSGKSVKLLTTHYKLQTENLWVIHDDLDIPLGKMKISKARGSAGHKGVQSIINELKTLNQSKHASGQANDFVRFRIGIKPTTYYLKPETWPGFVLRKFTKREGKLLKEIKKRACQALELAIKEGTEKAMSKYNR